MNTRLLKYMDRIYKHLIVIATSSPSGKYCPILQSTSMVPRDSAYRIWDELQNIYIYIYIYIHCFLHINNKGMVLGIYKYKMYI